MRVNGAAVNSVSMRFGLWRYQRIIGFMGDRLIVIGALVVVATEGFVTLVAARRRIARDYQFAHDFGERFSDFTRSEGVNAEAYTWLIQQSNKMQIAMGSQGVYAMFRPPFANFQYRNYPIILNLLPELRKAFLDPILSRNLAQQYRSAIAESLLRHVGMLEQRKASDGELLNPLVWLREGVRWLLSLPFALLAWTGLISLQKVNALLYSGLARVVTAFVTLVGLLSGVMGIILGWKEFSHWVAERFIRLF